MITNILKIPEFYKLLGGILGVDAFRKVFVDEFIKLQGGERVIDFGCGPGDMLTFLPQCDYVGIDQSKSYIDAALNLYEGAVFLLGGLELMAQEYVGKADVVIISCVFHHLNDREMLELLERVHSVLRPGGRLVSVDMCVCDNKPLFEQLLIKMDRGNYPRRESAMSAPANQFFGDVKTTIRENILRVPYTYVMMECYKD